MKIINISGEIGWDVMPSDVKKQLEEAKGKDIEVHVASPGGFVFDGIEIFNAFRDYKKQYPKAQMMLTIKGLAASMASYLAVNPAFDLVAAEDNAVFMIHNAWGGAVGDYREIKKSAEVLEGISDLLGQAYAKKTGKKKEEVKKCMDDESWYFGNEIFEHGFVDEIIKTPEKIEKDSALATGLVSFKAMSEKLKNYKTDFTRLAAVIKPEPTDEILTPEEIENLINLISDETSTTPASISAGENNNNFTEVKLMSLKELLDQNPAAKLEYEKELEAKFEAGKKAFMDVASKAATYANSKEYPEQVKAVALDVMQGKKSIESLDVLVANADMIKEMLKSKSAQEEQPEGGNGQQEPALSTDGTISSMADLKAEAARLKGGIN